MKILLKVLPLAVLASVAIQGCSSGGGDAILPPDIVVPDVLVVPVDEDENIVVPYLPSREYVLVSYEEKKLFCGVVSNIASFTWFLYSDSDLSVASEEAKKDALEVLVNSEFWNFVYWPELPITIYFDIVKDRYVYKLPFKYNEGVHTVLDYMGSVITYYSENSFNASQLPTADYVKGVEYEVCLGTIGAYDYYGSVATPYKDVNWH